MKIVHILTQSLSHRAFQAILAPMKHSVLTALVYIFCQITHAMNCSDLITSNLNVSDLILPQADNFYRSRNVYLSLSDFQNPFRLETLPYRQDLVFIALSISENQTLLALVPWKITEHSFENPLSDIYSFQIPQQGRVWVTTRTQDQGAALMTSLVIPVRNTNN